MKRGVTTTATAPSHPAEVLDQPIRSLTIDQRFFRLRKAIQVDAFRKGSLWVREYAPLHILGYGATSEESWASFLEDFASYWDGIAQEPGAHLHKSAREFKRKLLELVQSVEPAL